MLVYRQKITFKLLETIGKLQNIKWTQQIASECSYTQRRGREWSGSGGGCQRNINYSDSNEIIGLSDRVFPSSGWLYIDGCEWSGNEMLSVKWRSEELSNSMKSLVNSFVMLCEFEKWHVNVLPSIFHILALSVYEHPWHNDGDSPTTLFRYLWHRNWKCWQLNSTLILLPSILLTHLNSLIDYMGNLRLRL